MHPLQSRKISQQTALTTPFIRLLENADIREPCVELREDYEVSPRASAPRCSSNDGDMGERNDDRGDFHRGMVVEFARDECWRRGTDDGGHFVRQVANASRSGRATLQSGNEGTWMGHVECQAKYRGHLELGAKLPTVSTPLAGG